MGSNDSEKVDQIAKVFASFTKSNGLTLRDIVINNNHLTLLVKAADSKSRVRIKAVPMFGDPDLD